MSHYNVNASVPKTLIQHLMRWLIADAAVRQRDASECSNAIVDDADLARAGARAAARQPEQSRKRCRSLRAAGLQPLLHHPLRLPAEQGRLPRLHAWSDRTRRLAGHGARADAARVRPRRRSGTGSRYSCSRFFQASQFKRSAMPNGPKVGSGGSLSPRSDWRAPSDSPADGVARGAPRQRAHRPRAGVAAERRSRPPGWLQMPVERVLLAAFH